MKGLQNSDVATLSLHRCRWTCAAGPSPSILSLPILVSDGLATAFLFASSREGFLRQHSYLPASGKEGFELPILSASISAAIASAAAGMASPIIPKHCHTANAAIGT
jgi:hypothetical protein